MQDDLTKHSAAFAIPNMESETIAKVLVENYICIFGIPHTILSDQGTNFLSTLFADLCKLLMIKKLTSTAYHPQTNGALERSHRTLKNYLRHYVDKNLSNWDSFLPYAMITYNTSIHISTGFTPFMLVFGHEANLPSGIPLYKEHEGTYATYIDKLKTKLKQSHDIARANIIKEKEKSKTNYDKNINDIEFHVNDLVLLKIQNRKSLEPLWSGPYPIIAINSKENSTILINNKKRKVIII